MGPFAHDFIAVAGDPANTLPAVAGAPQAPIAAVAPACPPVLAAERLAERFDEFLAEFQPVGSAELALVRDLAWQAAATETWNQASAALLRQGARHLPLFALTEGDDSAAAEDAVLAAAVSADAVVGAEQNAQRRSRAFHRALRALRDLQSQRRGASPAAAPPNGFADESACEQHLVARFASGAFACPRCGSRRGCYLAARRAWECGRCGRQAGLRAGTVAADSPLPLATWFEAIRWLLWRPDMGIGELGRRLGLGRPATVRKLARKIRAALRAANASDWLAGLDRHCAPPRHGSPEPGVPDRAEASADGAERAEHIEIAPTQTPQPVVTIAPVSCSDSAA